MENFWSVFFKTLNRTLNILAVVSVILVFCLDMWLFDIKAPCLFFVACGKFFYGVGLSFIAAYIFYLITVHYPETHKAIIAYKVSDFPAMAIVTNIENIFIDMAKEQGQDLNYKALNDELIKGILSSTKCTDASPLHDVNIAKGTFFPKDWLKYIKTKEETYQLFINAVKPLFCQLDSEYTAAISEIEQCPFSQPIVAMVSMLSLTQGMNCNQMTFADGLEVSFLELYKKSQALRSIIEERRIRYKYL